MTCGLAAVQPGQYLRALLLLRQIFREDLKIPIELLNLKLAGNTHFTELLIIDETPTSVWSQHIEADRTRREKIC